MQDMMFSALFGALSTEHRMNFIANNLANVNTTGYKQDQLAFKNTMAQFAHDEIREPLANVRSKPLFPEPKNLSRTRIAVSEIDFSQGSMKFTGDPLDVAINGEGFFKVQTPAGERYTRSGHFVKGADGSMQTPQGWPLLGDGGPITIPAEARDVHIASDGQVFADGELINTITFVGLADPQALEKEGSNTYRVRPGMEAEENDPLANGGRISQGFVETANVEVVTEMVKMIEVNRHYEAMSKIMQTSATIDKDATERVAKIR